MFLILPEINLNINFKAQNRKTKTDTNPIPDPNRYRRHCPDPNARIQKFYTLHPNTTKEFTLSYYRKSFAGVGQIDGLNRDDKLFDK